MQALSGLASFQAHLAGGPEYAAMAVADKVSGAMLALAIVAALRHRDCTGVGQRVEVPMFETMVSFNLVEHLYGRSFVPPLGDALYPRVVSKFRKPYRTADGYLAALPYTDGHWLRFFVLIGQPECVSDPRFATMAQRTRHIDALYELLGEAMLQRTTADWIVAFKENDIPAVPVKSADELLDDPHLAAVGMFRQTSHPTEGELLSVRSPIRLSKSPLDADRDPPRLGENTADVLSEIGYDRTRIERLLGEEVIRAANLDPWQG